MSKSRFIDFNLRYTHANGWFILVSNIFYKFYIRLYGR